MSSSPSVLLAWAGRLLAVAMAAALVVSCAGRNPNTAIPQHALGPAGPVTPAPQEPSDLAGLRSEALMAALGAPSFVRKDSGIEMWRYDGTSCKAFFFLYPFGNSLLVRHVETLPRGREMAADRQCLDSLRTHPRAPVS